MALFSGRIAVRRALRVIGARHEHILSSVIGKPAPPAKWQAGVGDVGQVVVIGGGAIGSLVAGRIAAVPGMEKRVWMLTSWVEHAQVSQPPTMLSYDLHPLLFCTYVCATQNPRSVCAAVRTSLTSLRSWNISAGNC